MSLNKIYWIVYKTTNLINNKIYIGVHKTTTPYKFDGYYGCGISISRLKQKKITTHFQKAIIKYGYKNFKRETLRVFENEIDALDLEAWIVNKEFIERNDTYNIELGGGRLNKPLISRQVYLYDLNGNYIKSFNSISDASRAIYGTSKQVGTVSRACKMNFKCKNYYVSFVKYNNVNNCANHLEIKLNKFRNNYNILNSKISNIFNSKQVGQYDLNGNLIKIWDSLNQCRKIGKFTNVQAVIENKRKTCKGYTFKYIES